MFKKIYVTEQEMLPTCIHVLLHVYSRDIIYPAHCELNFLQLVYKQTKTTTFFTEFPSNWNLIFAAGVFLEYQPIWIYLCFFLEAISCIICLLWECNCIFPTKVMQLTTKWCVRNIGLVRPQSGYGNLHMCAWWTAVASSFLAKRTV